MNRAVPVYNCLHYVQFLLSYTQKYSGYSNSLDVKFISI